MKTQNQIVVFDGYCNFCSAGVRFILRKDRAGRIMFTHVQSKLGARLLKEHGVSSLDPDTFLFVDNGQVYVRSDAAIKISKYLGVWRVLGVVRFLPRAIRDFVYDVIARNRYTWFGKRDSCFLPSPEERNRFIVD